MDIKQSFDQLAGKSVLITGASGFIGYNLTTRLCDMGAYVHGTSRSDQISARENLKWWRGNFEDYETAKRLIREIKPDFIFHLAGAVTAANSLDLVLPTYHSLLTSTVNILTLATEIGCERIILTGSSTEPLDENPYPNSPYAAAKWATSAYGHLFQEIYKAPVIIVRPFMGYGPGQPIGKLIPHVILSLLKNESPRLSQGLWLTDWVYIDDTVDGILASAVEGSPGGKTIDLGSGVLTSVRQIVEKIVEIIEPEISPLFGALPDRHEEHTRVADTKYAFEKLNWKAKVSLEEGLRKTVQWYRDMYF
ncbi:MAG TPA: NAD-dependent epimerase/dehydratase family protein [Cytophagales bacterium]|nr:NAD-dependent epimerase/dehydratase family protein [Cytophagales bacterium]